MVQGLAFLSKKSWHTKNLANQEKVWMAEQQAAAEASKTKELAKQIQQEREQEELDRIAGKKSHRLDRGIDWMYQGGTGEAAKEDAAKQSEEYLMGKEYVPQGAGKGGDFSASLDNTGVNAVVATAAAAEMPSGGTASAPAVAEGPSFEDRNESFRVRHEDPMFLVSQKRREKEEHLAKKKALFERVVGPESTSDRRAVSREEDRKHRSRRDIGPESTSGRRAVSREEDRKHRSRRDKDSKKDRKRDRKRHHSRRDEEEYDDWKSRRRSRSRSRERSSRPHDRESRKHHRRSHRSRSHSEERTRHRRSESPYSRKDHRRDHRSSRREDDRMMLERSYSGHQNRPESHRSHPEEAREKSSGYGLQGATKLSSQNNQDLGPNQDLLARKRQEREAEICRARDKGSSRRHMTDEERAAALRDMQNEAAERDSALSKAASQRPNREDEGDREEQSRGKASFLSDMAQRTHGIQDSSSKLSLATRVAQNRHTNQRMSDEFL